MAGYSPQCHKELDMNEQRTLSFSQNFEEKIREFV